MKLFHSLRHRPFALLWSGQTISRIGDHLYQVALVWWVIQKTGSASKVAALMICSFVPMLLFLLVGGAVVDRYSRVRVMFLSDLARGILMGGIAILAWGDRLALAHVYAASLLFGFVDAFFDPAYTAAVPELTPPELLPSANSLTSLSQQFGRVAGPLLAASLIGVTGVPCAFALNGLSFFVAAGCLVALPRRPASQSPPARTERPEVFRGLVEGFAMVRAWPWLGITIAVFALSNVTLSGPYSVALPSLVKASRHAGVETLGLLYAMFPIGYGIAAVWLGNVVKPRRRGLIVYLGLIGAGLMLLVIGLPVPLAVLAGAAVFNGLALELAGLTWIGLLQDHVPGNKLGRIASIDSLGSSALLPVGYALTGWATDRIGAPLTFVFGGGITAVLAGIALAHRAVRKLQ